MELTGPIESGRLGEAIAAATAEVKARPMAASSRIALFELLCFAAEYDRAGRQLDALGGSGADAETTLGASALRHLLDASRARDRFWAEGGSLRYPLDPPHEVRLHAEAAVHLASSRPAEARACLDQAAAGAQPAPVRDADDVLGPVLEVYTAAGYFWVPWEHVQFLDVNPPRQLRDLLSAPARLATLDGQLGEVHLPATYPGTASGPDGPTKVGRATEWDEPVEGIVRGRGAKLFLVGDEARTLFELGPYQHRPADEPAEGGPS